MSTIMQPSRMVYGYEELLDIRGVVITTVESSSKSEFSERNGAFSLIQICYPLSEYTTLVCLQTSVLRWQCPLSTVN